MLLRNGVFGALICALLFVTAVGPTWSEEEAEKTGARAANVQKLSFGQGKDFSEIGVVEAFAAYAGEKRDYAYLMGVSGGAFRIAWFAGPAQPGAPVVWCPSSCAISPECVQGNALAAIGYTLTPMENKPLDDTWTAIVESMQTCTPIVSHGLVGAPEFCLIVGFEEEGKARRLLVRSYFDKGEEYSKIDFKEFKTVWDSSNYLGLIEKLESRPKEEDLVVQSLKRAVAFFDAGKTQEMWVCGSAAYAAWADALKSPVAEKDAGNAAWVNAWQTHILIDARKAAAAYLTSLKDRPELAEAAKRFEKETEILKEIQTLLPFSWDKDMAAAMNDAAKPMLDEKNRARAAEIVLKALEEDKAAIQMIRDCLKKLESGK
ncbi:MAG: hypothetical protein RDV41_14280 [Planctomycetota bacterium]|nr:hypothetical protein [Planctomycetota bacterium]